jgi:predicted dehydrogenase
MIRLAVSGANDTQCDELARRVRGAIVTILKSFDQVSAVDAVAFIGAARPDASHIEHCIAAGAPVLLATESTMADADLERWTRRCSGQNARVVVANPDRCAPSRRLIHDELRGTKLGVAGLIRLHRWETGAQTNHATLPESLVRDLDLAVWLKDQRPERIFATRTSADRSVEAIQVHMGFADGGMALIDHVSGLPDGDGYQSISTICANGAMYADDHSNRQLVFQGGTPRANLSDEGPRPLVNLIQQFVDELLSPASIDDRVNDWRRLQSLVRAVYRSLESGHAIPFMEGDA